MLSYHADIRFDVPTNSSGSYVKDFNRSGERLDVSFGGWQRYPDRGKAAHLTHREFGIGIYVGGETYERLKAATTPEECMNLYVELLLTWFAQNPKEFGRFLAAIQRDAAEQGANRKQDEIRKALGL